MNQRWKNGWYLNAKRIDSPNFDARPKMDIDTLVIHSISLPPGEYGGDYVEKFFLNQLEDTIHPFFKEIKGVRVSSHFYIKREGSIIQFVETENRAWHAGVSRFDGRESVNDFSIGVELEGLEVGEYSDAQYEALAELTRDLINRYPKLNANRIVGHNEIAPERKLDPGPWFDWDRYWDLIS